MSDEDTQHFLSMLDAAAERAFEAYADKRQLSSSSFGQMVPGPMFKADFGRSESLKEAIEREAALRPCTQVPSAGSTNSMRHNRTSNTRPPHQKWSQGHTSRRIAQELGQTSKMTRSRDSSNRNSCLIRNNIKGPLLTKVVPHDQISEETSWNSCASSGSTTQQSGSPSSLSGSYESSGSVSYDSDESEPLYEKVGHSTRMKQPEYTDSTTSGYDDTSSYSNSRDDYSDAKSSSQRKQPGHFHALVSGLMKHMKHSKKPKQVKNGFKGLESGRHGGKKKGKKLLWWPKIHGGRGGVKMPNKGKVRLGNYRTKSFAAAKMILKK
uniref:Uncharacterized protein n=1 Tax=Chenopodium quinoa TaxID=63459 RepID=A0A803KNF1_CHEQI